MSATAHSLNKGLEEREWFCWGGTGGFGQVTTLCAVKELLRPAFGVIFISGATSSAQSDGFDRFLVAVSLLETVTSVGPGAVPSHVFNGFLWFYRMATLAVSMLRRMGDPQLLQ